MFFDSADKLLELLLDLETTLHPYNPLLDLETTLYPYNPYVKPISPKQLVEKLEQLDEKEKDKLHDFADKHEVRDWFESVVKRYKEKTTDLINCEPHIWLNLAGGELLNLKTRTEEDALSKKTVLEIYVDYKDFSKEDIKLASRSLIFKVCGIGIYKQFVKTEDNKTVHIIEIYNSGLEPQNFSAKYDKHLLRISYTPTAKEHNIDFN